LFAGPLHAYLAGDKAESSKLEKTVRGQLNVGTRADGQGTRRPLKKSERGAKERGGKEQKKKAASVARDYRKPGPGFREPGQGAPGSVCGKSQRGGFRRAEGSKKRRELRPAREAYRRRATPEASSNAE